MVTNNPELPKEPMSSSRMSALVNKDKFMRDNMLVRRHKKKYFETNDEIN